MPDPLSIVVTRMIHAPSNEVCRGFTHKTLLRDWLCDASDNEPNPGGHLFLHWNEGRTVTGTYEQIEPTHELRSTWLEADLPVPTVVQVTCKAVGDSTQLILEHSSQEVVTRSGDIAKDIENFWAAALENLDSVIRTGIDLRRARRPRLGIVMDEFTPEAAQKLGVPVTKGVLLYGTAEGSGARAAGLVKSDVLISLNGVPLVAPASFGTALQGLKAGDRPIVEYYRGKEKYSVPLELGSFPVSELPDSAEELAAKVRDLDSQLMNAMRNQLDGLSEEEASRRPANDEWSVKELVAHFILCERDYQSWVADMLNDTPIEDWLMMRPNVQPRIAALTARMQTLPALLTELEQAKAETAAMMDAFPENFVHNRKHLYRRAASWEVEIMPDHYYEEHREQLQAAIHAAKG